MAARVHGPTVHPARRSAHTDPQEYAMEDVVRAAEQVVVLGAARDYVADIRQIDMTDAGQLVGHLMAAETLLMRLVDAFDEPTTT